MSFLFSIIVLPFYSLKRAEVSNFSFRPPVRTLVPYYIVRELKLPPRHLIDDAYITLDNLHYLGAYILIHIIGDGDAMLTVSAEFYGGINCL